MQIVNPMWIQVPVQMMAFDVDVAQNNSLRHLCTFLIPTE